jgi:hypothetical protein
MLERLLLVIADTMQLQIVTAAPLLRSAVKNVNPC